jgi:eukaryotic-like serine/threonine-protein kinase
MSSPGTSLVGTVVAERYRLESVLGTGGMGTVYQALQEPLRRRVALKLLHPQFLDEPEVIARFRREAKAASRVQHPSIAQIFDFGFAADQSPYLAMEFVEGESLSRVLEQAGPLSVARALNILVQVAESFVAMHGAGVVHRDLKPHNILVTPPSKTADRIKVLDFGLAKIVGKDSSCSLTARGVVLGTPEYMSPEQVAGEKVDARTDLYSFGVVAFQLLTGRVPFQGSVLAVMCAHIQDAPPSPSSAARRVDLPPALDRLVLRCLSKRREERFERAEHLLEALRSLGGRG